MVEVGKELSAGIKYDLHVGVVIFVITAGVKRATDSPAAFMQVAYRLPTSNTKEKNLALNLITKTLDFIGGEGGIRTHGTLRYA